MLWLKLMLVILISEIGERTMCSDSEPAPSTEEKKNSPVTLPPKSLLNATTSDGCNYSEIPYFNDEGMGIEGGFLAVSCIKVCPAGKKENVVEGYGCVNPDVEQRALRQRVAIKRAVSKLPNLRQCSQARTSGSSCLDMYLKASVNSLHGEEVNITVGTCVKETCQPDNPPQHRTVTLMEEGEQDEEDGDEEDEGEEEEEEEEEGEEEEEEEEQEEEQEEEEQEQENP
uniref:Putative transmembrane receptor wsc1 n=1 Tax=Ixodes ricinus TaxID=34613 RepID=A0A6B0V4I5_IXORI